MSDDEEPHGPNERGYIGRDDPREGERLAAQQTGAPDELRDALAGCVLPPRPSVLEVGCGSGLFTRALLDALPEARITATDVNTALLAEARHVLGVDAGPGGRVALARADATALPYRAQSFDLVACRFVLMHQQDPATAVAEMHRVTALGGTALAIEPDWGARALYPDSEALDALLTLARRARAYGFPDLLAGRKLFALFRSAGFAPVIVRTTPFVLTADDLARTPALTGDAPKVSFPGPERLLEQGRRILRGAGLITDADLNELIARLAAIPRSPDYCSAGIDLAVVGQKPAPRLMP